MRERVKQWRQKVTSFLEKHIKPQSIQMTIALSFTIVSVISMGILGISLYNRFVNKMEDMTTQSAEQLLNQTAINLESYLRNMRRISDAMYYSVIKDKDLATDSLDEEMNLLYEANKDNLHRLLYQRRKTGCCSAGCHGEEQPRHRGSGMVYGGDGTDGERAFFHAACTEFV